MEFSSDFRTRGSINGHAETDALLAEPCFLGATPDFVSRHGGDLARTFMGALPDSWKGLPYKVYVIGGRLYPGLYPTGPGWHVDGVPGTSLSDTQLLTREKTEHILCSVGSDGAVPTTRFAIGRIALQRPQVLTPEQGRFGWWHHQIESQLNNGRLTDVSPHLGELAGYDSCAFHCSPLVQTDGARVLMRASRIVGQVPRVDTVSNEVARIKEAFRVTGETWSRVSID